MKLSASNENYAATVVRVTAAHALSGLDNLVGVSVFGHQALTQKAGLASDGELKLAFTAETQLDTAYAGANDLYREKLGLNRDPDAKGYLEHTSRIKAIRLRGHRSDALLMPLSSLDYLGIDTSKLQEGDVFDTIDGHEICRKYEVKRRNWDRTPQNPKGKGTPRVSPRNFPEHFSTANFWRNLAALDRHNRVIVTQKLHGTSARIGNVSVARFTGKFGDVLNRVAPKLNRTYAVVAGSRKVIKDGKSSGYYATDIWSHWANIIGHKIPRGYMVFGEIIGWTHDSEGNPQAIQKNYTYDLEPGDSAFYLYRVTYHGEELSWEEVIAFAQVIGVRHVPELFGEDGLTQDFVDDIDALMDVQYASDNGWGWIDEAVTLSNRDTVDEGVCVRQDSPALIILKAKAGKFLEHETKVLDTGEEDIESAESYDLAG